MELSADSRSDGFHDFDLCSLEELEWFSDFDQYSLEELESFSLQILRNIFLEFGWNGSDWN
jgi:hypothetical protein